MRGGKIIHKDKYLVITREAFEEVATAELKTPAEIIEDISMRDCYAPAVYRIYDVSKDEPVELDWHGTHHKSGDPLYIKVTGSRGRIEFDGHGMDH